LKRFVFENTSIGKKSNIISEEAGTKLVLFTGLQKPKVTLEVLKGKSKIPETVDLDLAETIEVKGMKALGNRLSPHEVKSVELIAPSELEQAAVVIPNPIPGNPGDDDAEMPGVHTATPISSMAIDLEDVETETGEAEELEGSQSPNSGLQPEAPDKALLQIEEVESESSAQPKEEPKPLKKIDFEITNPEDLDFDDKGQLGLF